MRRSLVLAAVVLVAVPALAADNKLTRQEVKDGWKLLFNGEDLTGWKGGAGWKVDDGAIARLGGGGMIWYDDPFEDFVLKIDYKFDKPGTNSGLFLRTANKGDCVQTGFEMQVLSDHGGQPSKHSNGALYDAAAPSKNLTKPVSEWNQVVVIARGSKITIKMSGQIILDIDLDDWKEARKNPDGSGNKFRTALKDFARKGYIGMEDHGGNVWYRNIKIRVLDAEP